MNNLAIIPARSGSKGLKDKNIKELCGKPLLAYTIESAISSGCFNEIMVSTNSKLYAEIAKKYGASVPFMRSESTSSDTASSWDMVAEVLKGYSGENNFFDTFCLLQPTSPLRTAEDIRSAYEIYKNKATFAVISVCEAEHSPLWTGRLPENMEFDGFIEETNMKQRQSFGKFYRLNGAIYIINTRMFTNDRFFYKKGSFAYLMPQIRSIDIDSEVDFILAETLIKRGKLL